MERIFLRRKPSASLSQCPGSRRTFVYVFHLSFVASWCDFGVVEQTIATFKWLYAFLAFTITRPRVYGSKVVGGHRQELNIKISSSFFQPLLLMRNKSIGACFEGWYSEILTVTSLSVQAPQKPASFPFHHNARVSVYSFFTTGVTLSYRRSGFQNILPPIWALFSTSIFWSLIIPNGKWFPSEIN